MLPVYRFGGFQLHAASRELRTADGQRVALPARAFDCVLHLIEQRERAVGRDELIAVVWNRVDVSDNTLAQLMTRVRRLLDDTGEEQRIIRTVAGFGYQWVAPVEGVDEAIALPLDAAAAPVVADEPPFKPPAPIVPETARTPTTGAASAAAPVPTRVIAPSRRWRRAALVAGLALAAGAAVLLRPWSARETAPVAVPAAPVAVGGQAVLVLPAQITPVAEGAWQPFGVMATIGESLQMAGLAVVPPDNVVRLLGADGLARQGALDPAALARSAGATVVLQPRVRQQQGQWQVILEPLLGAPTPTAGFTAAGAELIDVARAAAESYLASRDLAPMAWPTGPDRGLAVLLRQAEGASLAGQTALAREVLQRAAVAYPEAGEPVYQLARLDVQADAMDAAAARLDGLLARLNAHDAPLESARALNLRGIVCYWQDDAPCVERLAQQAIDRLAGLPNAAGELGRAYFVRSMATFATAQWDAALADLSRARMAWVASGEALGIARIDGNVGIIQRQRGRTHEAIGLLRQAADRLRVFGETIDEAFVRKHLALALVDAGDPAAALAEAPRLQELAAQVSRPSVRAELELFHAALQLRVGQLDAAGTTLAALDARGDEAGDGGLRAGLEAVMARHALARGDTAGAESALARAFGAAPINVCDPRGTAAQFLALARLRVDRDPAAAAALRDAMQAQVGNEGQALAQTYGDLIDARIAIAEHAPARAAAAFDAALAGALARGVPADLLAVAEDMVPWLLAQGETARAAEVVGRLGDLPRNNYQAALLELRLYRATGPREVWQRLFGQTLALAGQRVIPPELHPGA